MIDYKDFQKIDIRVGKIVKVEKLPNPKYTTHKLKIDFGDKIGVKQSCARVNQYSDSELMGKLVIAVINFSPKQIGKNISEVLVLGLPDSKGECVLVEPDKKVLLGGNLY